ncbi:MAG: TraB/GumN family protein [Asticcacaulis sp.]|uniref:TraB/GumN family protein n=1 Tax=Asticcacaulis sp. TaxID=1872648 RepID=UPI003F7B6430
MWKLSKGGATVWVLPMINPVPKDLAWDSSRLLRILKISDAIYIPKPDKPTTVQKIPANGKLSEFLSKNTYKRLLKVIDRENLSHRFLLRIKPAYLGGIVYNQSLLQRGYIPWLDMNTFNNAVQKSKIKIIDLPWHSPEVGFEFMQNATVEQADYCLNLFLDSLDQVVLKAPLVAKAWSSGDLQAVLNDYSADPYNKCELSQKKYADEYKIIVDDEVVHQIQLLLNDNRTNVIVLPLDDVLKKEGIFDKLRDDGVEITAPPQ